MAYGNPQRLYVLETSDGIVKAGITSRDEERMKQHGRDVHVVRHCLTALVSGVAAEGELIRRLRRIGSVLKGREWFVGIRFAQAAQLARQIAKQFAHINPLPEPGMVRKTAALLSFNRAELAVLDAYCAKFGLSRGRACRDLALGGLVDLLHGKKFTAQPTFNQRQVA